MDVTILEPSLRASNRIWQQLETSSCGDIFHLERLVDGGSEGKVVAKDNIGLVDQCLNVLPLQKVSLLQAVLKNVTYNHNLV